MSTKFLFRLNNYAITVLITKFISAIIMKYRGGAQDFVTKNILNNDKHAEGSRVRLRIFLLCSWKLSRQKLYTLFYLTFSPFNGFVTNTNGLAGSTETRYIVRDIFLHVLFMNAIKFS